MSKYKTKIRTYCGGALYEAGDIVPDNVAKAIGYDDCELISSKDDTVEEKAEAKTTKSKAKK